MNFDLVCRNVVDDADQPRYFSDYGDKIYPFYSPECKRRFDDHPDSFIQQKAKEDLGME